MKTGLKLVLTAFATLFLSSAVAADVEIGNGFSCNGTSVMKGSQVVEYSKARSTLAKTLRKLKTKKKNAAPKKKPAIKAKIEQAKNSKTLLLACSNGELDPNETEDIFQQLSSGDGTFTGQYNATVGGLPFPINGAMTLSFTLDGTIFGALLTFDGELANALDAEPLAFSADVGGVAFPAQFFLPDTFLGEVTLSISESGQLTVTNSGSPNTVNLQGQFSNNAIDGSLTGSYGSVGFNGTFALDRES